MKLALLLVSLAFVTQAAPAADQVPDLQMHGMTKEVLALQRYLFSDADFLSPKNDQEIRAALSSLQDHLGRLQKVTFHEQPALRTNLFLLSDEVDGARRAFDDDKKAYARYLLVGALQLCAACHTRTAAPDFVLPASELKGAGLLDKANFYFATRQFEKGRDAYAAYPDDAGRDAPPGSLRAASLALAIYYARVKDDPAGGRKAFADLARSGRFSAGQRKQFRAWSEAFRRWKRGPGAYEEAPAAEKLAQARKILRENTGRAGDEVRKLRASSFLHAVLEDPAERSPEKAEALLRLGQVYGALGFPLYAQLGDEYLKACIADYPKSQAARDCYTALAASVQGRVDTGPAGGVTMEEVELFRWKKLAF